MCQKDGDRQTDRQTAKASEEDAGQARGARKKALAAAWRGREDVIECDYAGTFSSLAAHEPRLEDGRSACCAFGRALFAYIPLPICRLPSPRDRHFPLSLSFIHC